MTKKIFQSILLVAGCVLLASLLIIMGFLYDYFGGVEGNQLRDELSLASAAVEDGGTDYLARLTAASFMTRKPMLRASRTTPRVPRSARR